jgi:hypothetical protein
MAGCFYIRNEQSYVPKDCRNMKFGKSMKDDPTSPFYQSKKQVKGVYQVW